MPNRVIKESIWNSPTLSKLPLDAQLHWPRWLLMADDWGCFNSDPDVIKGLIYPKISSLTSKKISQLIEIYNNSGLIFIWTENDRQWGFFVRWGNHQFCNRTHVDSDGKQLRHKRKTPEPEQIELNQYLQGLLERGRAVQNKYRNPNPNPNPNKKKKIYGEFQHVLLTDEEIIKLKDRLKGDFDNWIAALDEGIEMKGYKYKNHYLTILKWIKNKNKEENKYL